MGWPGLRFVACIWACVGVAKDQKWDAGEPVRYQVEVRHSGGSRDSLRAKDKWNSMQRASLEFAYDPDSQTTLTRFGSLLGWFQDHSLSPQKLQTES
jgi:hypothetical protein